MKYKSIDYKNWNFNGKGLNILKDISSTEKKIWKIALPFQDKRGNIGHTEFVTYFAIKLNNYLKGNRNITIPAAILHDVGWGQLTKKELKQFYLPNWKDFEPELRKRHQEEGIKLAKKLLNKINYSQNQINEILEIILQHDTRIGFFSKNDGIVRDADKLWRFTLPLFRLVLKKRGTIFKKSYKRCLEDINKKGFFYSGFSKKIAKKELENTLKTIKSH